LIVAGGANFPKAMPWEGGQKVWYDSVFVLPDPAGNWLTGFKLPRPLGYGISVSTPRGVLCAGGSDAKAHSRDTFLLSWVAGRIEIESLPPLPQPLANGCAALVGNTVYVAGGSAKPDSTNGLRNFWAFNLADAYARWQELEPWPGPPRLLAVAGAYDGCFYLFGGAELTSDEDGKTVRRWLKDAHRYAPGNGWSRLADLPRAAVAAPSPAIAFDDQLLIVSGDDGATVNFEPKSAHPGFPKEVLAYDSRADNWGRLGESPLSRATVPVVQWRDRAVIPNGEIRPGVRTPEVWQLRLPQHQRSATTP
jgi:N-acetylneuraminic acid mutarotase